MSFQRVQDIQKTRKDHVCTGCLQKIVAGSNSKYVVGVYEGDFSAVHMCNACHSFWDGPHSDIFEDGWMPGDIGEARREFGVVTA